MNETTKKLAINLKILMDHRGDNQTDLAKRAGVSQKTISNMLNPEDDKSPNLKKVSLVARAYGLQTWHLLYPDAPIDILINTDIEKLVSNYINTDQNSRKAISQVAEVTANR